MPPAKKQKTARDSGVFVESSDSEDAFEPVRPHKNDKNDKNSNQKTSKDKTKNTTQSDESEGSDDPAPHAYICTHRPFFDVESANWLTWSTNPSAHLSEPKDVLEKLYKPCYEESKKIYKLPAAEHPEHKWCMMWGAWCKADVLSRKAKYCDPDAFGMHLYNDWQGWGMQEIGENMMIEFDKAFRSKGDKRIEEMWIVISAVGLWLNGDENIGALINNEDGDTTCELIGLMGCALLAALAIIDTAGELRPDSRFLDLTLVIAYYLELSHDLPAYGIEGECVAWRREAVKYFKKGKLDPERGLAATKLRIEKLEQVDVYDEGSYEENIGTINKAVAGNSAENPVTIDDSQANKENANPKATGEKPISPPPSAKRKRGLGNTEWKKDAKDAWKWADKFKKYKQGRAPVMGGQKYDITKMSRADRAAAAFDGKDPLVDDSAKDLKDNALFLA